MKTNIHPQYFNDTKVICSCGNIFTIGSTVPVIHVELCDKCHPFYTGEQKFVDSASRIQKFQQRQTKASAYKVSRLKKIDDRKRKDDQPKTLREMLAQLK
ncbi:50S ribosomal protein L31 [Patescibacteria group bacterium]|nr:50S ribosomal protein L31 [Patescibacteria group bacterium]MCL5010092.1 50S ribosomal protein L31 [Patescibacteria group bacterium]